MKPCPASQPFCRKAVYICKLTNFFFQIYHKYTINELIMLINFLDYFMNSREYIIIRECAKWWNSDKECYRGRYPRDSYQYVCECKNTGCNRSTRFSSKTIIFLYILCQIIIFIVGNPTWHKCIFKNRLETFNWLSWRHSFIVTFSQ